MHDQERLAQALADRYRIEREIGSGGMATVYLAEDLKHHRKVAVKVLNPALSAVMGTGRFLAEIETTANLQHPNILPLFDSGEAGGFLFYVMPFVEGESLRQKLSREKQLSVAEAVGIATDVAEALQAAHDHGVIHRDIKPANILLSAGKPLVADFGIALAVSEAGGGRLTETGLSLGSPHYMSPEQLSADRDPTKASDVYSLGCVLYEMLLGEPPFTGATAQAVFAKILTEEPTHPTGQRKTIPKNVDAAIRRSLEKLPADRFATAKEFASALADPGFRHGSPVVKETGAVAARPWRRLAQGLGVTTAVLSLALAWSVLQPEPPGRVARFSLAVPDSWPPSAYFALSPDGSTIVYRGVVESSAQLFLRRLENPLASPVAGTEGAFDPFFSPDGQDIVFLAGDEMKVWSSRNGVVRTLADSAVCCPVWNPDGYIYFSHASDFTIRRIPAAGGSAGSVTLPDPEGHVAHGGFFLVPGGDVGVFVDVGDPTRIEAMRLSTGVRRTLTAGTLGFPLTRGAIAVASPDGQLMVAPFDARRLELTAAPIPVLEGIQIVNSRAQVAVSGKGDVLFWTQVAPGSEYELVWVTRSGAAYPVQAGWTFDPGSDNRGWDLSPDGSRLALKRQTDLGPDIWIKELPEGPPSRFTFHEGEDRFPRWSPDGNSVTFLSDRGGNLDVWAKSADGIGDPELIFDHELTLAEAIWSPDQEWLVVRTGNPEGGARGGRDILAVRPGSGDAPIPLANEEWDEAGPALSPDGRWLAYQSDETGRKQIYVRPFPDARGRKVQISEGGGRAPVWAHSGEELFYLADMSGSSTTSGNRLLMSARIRAGTMVSVIERRVLFPVPDGFYFANHTTSYLVTADDQRFLMARAAGTGEERETSELVLILNFFDGVMRDMGR